MLQILGCIPSLSRSWHFIAWHLSAHFYQAANLLLLRAPTSQHWSFRGFYGKPFSQWQCRWRRGTMDGGWAPPPPLVNGIKVFLPSFSTRAPQRGHLDADQILIILTTTGRAKFLHEPLTFVHKLTRMDKINIHDMCFKQESTSLCCLFRPLLNSNTLTENDY